MIAESVSSGVAELRPVLEQSGGRQLVDKLPRLAHTGAQLGELAERVDWQRIADSGLLEKLTAPDTLEHLGVMLDKIELVAFLAEAMDGFLRRSDEVAESVAGGVADLQQSLPKIDGEQLRSASERLPDLVEAGEVLAEAGMFERSTVEVLGRLGRTIAESHEATDSRPRQTLGLFGLLKALRDPMVQNTLALGLDVARRYGARLEERRED